MVVALPLGIVMLRLRGSFVAIRMFGLARVFEAVAFGWSSLTQGGTGLYLPPAFDLRPLYYVLAALALAVVVATYRLDNSRFGLQILAIREDEDAAEALGVKTTQLKVIAFVLSAIGPGLAGGLYSTYLAFIDPPTAFSPATELTTIAMVLFGGMSLRLQNRILGYLERLRWEGVTLFLIDHEMRILMNVCDTALAMDAGEIIATSPPEVIRTDPRVLAAYF